MSLLSASDLSKYYGAEEIFGGINLTIPARARIGVVGPNGAGKTTLIDILAGRDFPTSGNVTAAGDLRLAYLPQRPELAGEHSLWREQLNAFAELLEMKRQLEQLEHQLAESRQIEGALERYGSLQAEFERRGGYQYETRTKMVLSGLGFSPDEYDMPLPQLSGGQKTRALLCRLLLEEPDCLVMDEPTNHLDIYAVEWLENYLKTFPGAVVAASHDRYFLDNYASVIWELEYRQLVTYRGNYSHYLSQRATKRETLRHAYYWQQQFIKKEEEFIRRHMGSRGTAQAKGRLKRLETMKKRGRILESGPRQRRKMFIDMGEYLRSGDQVLITRDLRIGYSKASALLSVPDVLVLRGETVAIIGPNGVGKSTLIKTLTGDVPALQGDVRLGANVKVGYFAQAHETLNAANSILDEITATKAMSVSAARDFLGRFLFSNDDVFRPVSSLSGGERGRVALAKLALLGANLLLLDEPTNHLDIDSQEVLQTVMQGFGGAILFVSHDRYLIDALATQIWEITPGEMTVFAGGYQEYLDQRNRRRGQKAASKSASSDSGNGKGKGQGKRSARYSEKVEGLNPFEAARRASQLEAKIDELESSLAEIGDALHAASTAGDAERVHQLGEAYARTEADLETALEEWAKFAH